MPGYSKGLLLLLIALTVFSCKPDPENKDNPVNASDGVFNQDLDKKNGLDKIQLPAGFSISVFAQVPNARSLCLTRNGTVFAGNREEDKVYAITDVDKNGRAERLYTIAKNLNMPCGVAFRNGSLYVAEVNRILRFDDIENRLNNPPQPVVVFDKYPEDGHHGWKYIALCCSGGKNYLLGISPY